MLEGLGIWMPRVAVHCNSHAPARLAELLSIELHLERLGRTSYTFGYDAFRLPERTHLADGQVTIATVLRGKHKAIFTPHVDTGDYVIVVNCEKVKLTGRKRENKIYYRHSGYTGNLRSTTADKLLDGPHADRVLGNAVRGMLPKNSLGRTMFRKLKIYKGPEHPHAAQQPEEFNIG